MLSPFMFRLSVVCLSVTFVRPTQPATIRSLVPWPSVDIHGKFYRDRLRETPPSEGLNARGVAKYNDFVALRGHILKTAQERRQVSINH